MKSSCGKCYDVARDETTSDTSAMELWIQYQKQRQNLCTCYYLKLQKPFISKFIYENEFAVFKEFECKSIFICIYSRLSIAVASNECAQQISKVMYVVIEQRTDLGLYMKHSPAVYHEQKTL